MDRARVVGIELLGLGQRLLDDEDRAADDLGRGPKRRPVADAQRQAVCARG
jgi:hypothetical protein